MALLLSAAVRDQIIEHAVHSLPAEAVGLLAGKENKVQMALAIKNVAGEKAFLADPYDQFKAERAIRSKGLNTLAIYHSHPDGCACLSDLDIALAVHWRCVHIVVSLETGARTAELRGYRIFGRLTTEVDLICIGTVL